METEELPVEIIYVAVASRQLETHAGILSNCFFLRAIKMANGGKKETKLLKFPYYTQCEISIFFNPQQKKSFLYYLCIL